MCKIDFDRTEQSSDAMSHDAPPHRADRGEGAVPQIERTKRASDPGGTPFSQESAGLARSWSATVDRRPRTSDYIMRSDRAAHGSASPP